MIHKALKVIRQFHGITQVELANNLGISKSHLSEIESGKKTVTLNLLEAYSKKFDIPVSSLVFFSESIGDEGKIPKKIRLAFTGKIIELMEWLNNKDESKKIKA